MKDTSALFVFGAIAALVGELVSALLEHKAHLRGRPAPAPLSRLWTIRAVLVLGGAIVLAAGAAIWNSLAVLMTGIVIALAGVAVGFADKARRAFGNG